MDKWNLIKRTAFAAAMLIFVLPLHAITEQDVVEAAIKNNRSLLAAQKMARSYEAKSHKQFFLDNPMIGIEYMGVRDNGIDLGPAMEKNIVITQKIPFPLKYIWKAGAAGAESDLYRYMYDMKKLETVNETRQAYYELYKTTKFIEITAESSALLKQLSSVAFTKYNQGTASQQDVAKADLENYTLENDLLTLNRQKEIDLQRLRQVTADSGLLTSGAYSLEEPQVPELKQDFEEVKARALRNAPVIKAAAAAKSSAENMRNMAVSDYIPDLNVEYRKNFEPGGNDYSLMLEAEVPVFFLTNQQADIGEKWDMADSKALELDAENDSVIFQVKDHFETIKSNYRSIDLFKNKLIPQSEAALKSALSSYQAKKIEFMQLLDSERMLLDMKKEYYMALTEYLMHYRMLEELCGSLE